jgi:hypothetical protein
MFATGVSEGMAITQRRPACAAGSAAVLQALGLDSLLARPKLSHMELDSWCLTPIVRKLSF